jgi:hypothetical protein
LLFCTFLKLGIFQKQVERNKEFDSPVKTKEDNNPDQTSQEGTYSRENKPANKSPVEITMIGTDHHSKAQPESPASYETDNARTKRNKRRKQKAAENQTAQLSSTDNNQNNTEQAKNKLLQNLPETGLDDNSVLQKQTGTDTSTKATSEESSSQLTQKNHTRDTKQQEPLSLVRLCPKCHMTHLPCDCSSTFWNCGYCDVGLSYYFRDKIR